MMRERRTRWLVLSLVGLALMSCLCSVKAENTLQPPVKLIWHYYKLNTTCPDAETYIKHQVKLFWQKDKRITAKFLRLLSADCLSKNVYRFARVLMFLFVVCCFSFLVYENYTMLRFARFVMFLFDV